MVNLEMRITDYDVSQWAEYQTRSQDSQVPRKQLRGCMAQLRAIPSDAQTSSMGIPHGAC